MAGEAVLCATKDRQEADEFIIYHKGLKHTVIQVSPIEQLEMWKDGAEQDPWKSGVGADWIVLLATSLTIQTPGKVE